jgi:tRNA dimethylallyltransferase
MKGEIISMDSRQVYRGMDIGTGKDREEYRTPEGTVPSHLVDIVDPSHVYTLWEFQRDFYRTFRDIRSRGAMPVAVGGTGLYVEAVLKHYRLPNVPENPAVRRELMERPKERLESRLKELDPELWARTDRSSKKRLVRGLEVALYAQEHVVRWGQEDPPELTSYVVGVRWDRAELRKRIRRRLDNRFEAGLIEEVRRLLNSGIDRGRFDLFGLEYKHVARFLDGEVSLEQMRRELLTAIGRFAKRQETYFRGMARRGIAVHWVQGAERERAVEEIVGGI